MDDIVISQKEAAEFAEFKRQKRVAEVCRLLKRIECDLGEFSGETLRRKALACRDGGYGAVRVNPLQIAEVKPLVSPLPVVCRAEEVNSALKTKVAAVRAAVRAGADEVIIALATLPERAAYRKKELKRLKKASGKKIGFFLHAIGKEAGLYRELALAVPAEGELVRAAKSAGCAVVTAEGSVSAATCRALLSEGADRICTADYVRLAEDLFAEANREEIPARLPSETIDVAPRDMV